MENIVENNILLTRISHSMIKICKNYQLKCNQLIILNQDNSEKSIILSTYTHDLVNLKKEKDNFILEINNKKKSIEIVENQLILNNNKLNDFKKQNNNLINEKNIQLNIIIYFSKLINNICNILSIENKNSNINIKDMFRAILNNQNNNLNNQNNNNNDEMIKWFDTQEKNICNVIIKLQNNTIKLNNNCKYNKNIILDLKNIINIIIQECNKNNNKLNNLTNLYNQNMNELNNKNNKI